MPRKSLVSQAMAQIEGFAQRYEYLNKYNRVLSNAEVTFERYIVQFAKFCLHFNRYPDEVSNEEFVEYYDSLMKQNPSGGTMKLAVYGVRLYFDAYGLVPPKHAVPVIKDPKRVATYLTEDQCAILVYSGETRKDRVAFGTMLGCGPRAKELVNLKVADINLKAKLLTVRGGKGDKDRVVPIPNLLCMILADYIEKEKPQTYLIESEPGKPVSVSFLRYRLNKAAIRSGITQRIYLHLFRSSYAIHSILNGLNIYSLAKYMGHSSIVTTAQYLKALPDDVYGQLSLAFDKIFPLEHRRALAQQRPDLDIIKL